ncbi:AraC family transcriptional regulator [Marinomonas sp. GJ51-6]|uniref:helix-turn-helix transcriptional regulator n=1 Tax=Marinomonas sp. GJ51-6 TaxID=2992802 RepID=UPI0029350CAB|nr:AraC family transcriptional regulator [Marinomonas sp. GJ51-6]WOD08373.1 AraC family transcriptional regulator [Marinomonas sp. GJ51-6]
MLNVPVIKPLLIFVLSGNKSLGSKDEIHCPSGSFVFLSNTPEIAMRNVPNDVNYFALLIEFEYSDFDCLKHRTVNTDTYFQGQIEPMLEQTLQQFVEWSAFSPPDMWYLRRQEILQVLLSLGFDQVEGIMEPPTLSHKVYTIIREQISSDLGAEAVSSMLGMSESSLRRKLSAEGSHFQGIKDKVKLGYGLHLIQTSFSPIGLIAEKCGYASQSRFTEKFKQLFGITPTALRKTRVSVLGE